MNKGINTNKIASTCLCLLIFLPTYILSFYFDMEVYMAVCVLLMSAFMIYRSRNNWLMLIIFGFIFYCNYSSILFHYFGIGLTTGNSYSNYYKTNTSYYGIQTLYLFTFLLCIFLLWIRDLGKGNDFVFKPNFDSNDKNWLIGIATSFIMLLVLFFGFKTSSSGRIDATAIGEYSIIFLIIGFWFCKNNRVIRVVLLFESLVFCAIGLFGGSRIAEVQVLILLFLVFFVYKVKRKRHLILPLLLALIFLKAIGTVRGDSISLISIEKSLEYLLKSGFSFDTAFSAYHTSLVICDVSELLTFSERIELLWRFVLSIFLGGSVENSSLSVYIKQYHWSGGGGFLPFYFDFYLGHFGTILISMLVGIYISLLARLQKNNFLSCLSIYLCATVPRWYLYSPTALFRGLLLFSLVFFLFSLLSTKKMQLNTTCNSLSEEL